MKTLLSSPGRAGTGVAPQHRSRRFNDCGRCLALPSRPRATAPAHYGPLAEEAGLAPSLVRPPWVLPVRPRYAVCAAAVDAGAASSPAPGSDDGRQHALAAPAIAAGLLLAAAGAFLISTPGQALRANLAAGPLGSSGCLAAFSLISLSELGDKTFFISAILAARIGRAMSFAGSLAALALLTVVNVAIGTMCARCPDTLLSRLQLPVAELASIAVLGFFGLRAIKDGLKGDSKQPMAASPSATPPVAPPPVQPTEFEGARSAVRGMTTVDMMGGRGSYRSPMAVFFEVASLIFQAEWGDRSMLATIALASSHSPVGVAVGAIGGHAVATGIAVVGGAIAGKYVSERTINLISGTLFLVFAAVTAYGLL